MARKPSTKSLVPDLPDSPDGAKMFELEHTEFDDNPDSISGVYAVATTAVATVTGIEAETHLTQNTDGKPRVAMRLGTYRRITDFLSFLDVSNVALRAAVGDYAEKLDDSERQRAELKTATVAAAAEISDMKASKVAAEAEIVELKAALASVVKPEKPAPTQTKKSAAAVPTDAAAAADLRTKVNKYRANLATQRGGAEALLAFDEIFLAANKL